jgi:hypothetical protein
MAYRKGVGHDMALFAATEAALHAKFKPKGKKPRLYAVCIDIEQAFNGTWRELVETLEWKRFDIKGTLWSVSRSISGDMKYRVQIHGNMTEEFTQKRGYGQGPGSSPTKYNISMEPLLHALEDAGAGVSVGGENVLDFA